MSQPHKICPRCHTPADLQAPQCLGCGRIYRTQFPQNPDRTTLGVPESPPQPMYPVQQYEPPAPMSYDPAGAQPYYPEQGYQQPGQQVHIHVNTPVAAPEGSRQDTCAIMSAVLGILSLLFFCWFGWIFGLGGIALGVISLIRLRSRPYLDGAPIAITGIVLSIVPVVFNLWWMAAFMQAASTTTPR